MLKNPAVQNWLGQKISSRISKELDTKVTVKRVGFSLFNHMDIEGLYIEDLNKDTLLYAGKAQVNITDWFFFKDKATLSYIGLQNFVINTYRNDSIWNYQFVINKFGSSDTSKKSDSKGGLQLDLKYILLENGDVRQRDKWVGHNQNISFKKAEIDANSISFANKVVNLNTIIFNAPKYQNYTYAGLKPTKVELENNSQDTTKPTKHWQLFGWDVQIKKFQIKDGIVDNGKQTIRQPYTYFDGQHLLFSNINGTFEKIKWNTDTITLQLNLSAKERSGLHIKNFKSDVKAYPNTIAFNKLLIETDNSIIKNSIAFSFDDFEEDINDFIHKITINAILTDTKISPIDLAIFSPSIKSNIKKDVWIDGRLNGTVSSFRLYNGKIKTGYSTIQGNVVMTGLPNINETYIDFNNGNISTNFTDLKSFAPSLANINGVELNKLGQINYKGNFTGFINDFVTFGTLQTNLGTVITDLNMKLLPNTKPSYSGKIITSGFALGSLLNDKNIGNIGFNGKLKGSGFNINNIDADIDGTTTSLQYGNYTYQNITTKGKLHNKSYKGSININDNNLIADINGIIDFTTAKPKFDLKANIEKSNFKKLQFIKDDYELTGKVALNFEGTNLDDFDGTITLDGATIKKDGEALPFSFLTLQSNKTSLGRYLQVNSNELDGYVNGKFTYANIINAFSLFLHNYYPDVFAKPNKFDVNQNFEFELKTKKVDAYTKLVSKELRGFNNALLKGSINTVTNEASFEGDIPFFGFKDYVFDNLVLKGKGNTDSLTILANVGKLNISDSLSFLNSALNIQTINNQSTFSIQSFSDNTLNALDVNGTILVFDNGIQINFEPSSFAINNKVWKLQKNGELTLRDNIVSVSDLKFEHNNQEIEIRTEASSVGNTNEVVANVKNIEINDFAPLFIKGMNLHGKLNGTIKVTDPAGKPIITTNSYIDNFVKDNDSIGKVMISGKFDVTNYNTDYSIKSEGLSKYLFDVEGHYYPKDSTNYPIYNKIKLNGTELSLIEPYLSSVFRDVKGNSKGELEIFGDTKNQFITGTVEVDTLSMIVKYTNVKYKSYKPIIEFKLGEIEFSGIEIKDTLNHTAQVKTGKIIHSGFFKNMGLDIELKTDTMLLLNTDRTMNSTFYGTAIADAKMKLKGSVDNRLKMEVIVNNPKMAKINLNTASNSKTLGKADFIEFKTYGKDMGSTKAKIASSFVLDMILNANTNAEINVILDELAGDRIRAKGNGSINLGITDGEVKLGGIYTVEEGDYTFSLQSWFRKNFKIDKGSTISWNGNPYDANINITAQYTSPKVALNDLFTNTNNNTNVTSDLLVSAKLSDKLSKPDIKFSIRYPDNVVNKDPLVENLLTLISRDENQLNKQVAFLILFDRLLPYDNNTSNNGTFGNVAINTISGLLTQEANNAINNLLKGKFNNTLRANIDFRTYSPGGLVASQNTVAAERATSTFGISKSWLNERLVFYINGNLDFGLLSANQSSFALLPNLVVEYKIIPNGGIVATFFHRQSLDALVTNVDNRRISTGLGVAWRKESDDFWDLFRFKKKKKKS